jgi:hypothetical protein
MEVEMVMRRWRIGTISMGALLVAVGVIMFISRINGILVIEHTAKYWPVVLILLGIEVFVGSLLKNENTEIKFDGVSITIVVTIILLCAGIYGVSNYIW